MTTSPPSTRRAEFLAGMQATIPLTLGALPFGIIFGALAVTSGIGAAGAMALSLIVFAGSSQFIAVGLFRDNASAIVIIMTTFIVNVRHALYSASLAPYMKHLSQRWLLPLMFWLTDETFVIAIQRYQAADESPYKHWFYFGSALLMYVNWSLYTLIGVVAGSAISDPASWGLDFAMSATFIGMIMLMLKARPMLAAAVTAAIVAVVSHSLPYQLWLIAAALAGVAAGVIVESARGTPAADVQPTPQEAKS